MANNYFQNLSFINMSFIKRILENKALCKLVFYNTTDALNQPDVTNPNQQLLMKHVFPLPKKITAETSETTILNISLKGAGLTQNNKGFVDEYLVIDIISHLNVWLLDDEKIRVYEILSEIDKTFNNVYINGVSTNNILLYDLSLMAYSDYFYGIRLIYKLTNNSNVK